MTDQRQNDRNPGQNIRNGKSRLRPAIFLDREGTVTDGMGCNHPLSRVKFDLAENPREAAEMIRQGVDAAKGSDAVSHSTLS